MEMELRAEKHVIKPSDPYYGLLVGLCHRSKNLYNHANYLIRQAFIKEGIWLRYRELDQLLKKDRAYPDYQDMPTAQCAQQALRMLDANWKSFFKVAKDYKKHPEKYLGRPKLPKYLKKDGCYVLTLTNQNCRVKDGILHFPKAFCGLTARPGFLGGWEAPLLPTGQVPPKEGIYYPGAGV